MTKRMERGTGRAEVVYEAIRRDILSGRLVPGARLPFAELVERYQSSIGVIREGLQRLLEQGLVTSEPRLGFFVITVGADELRELTTARTEIEILALRYAIQDGDTEWEAQLVAAHHRLAAAHQYDDVAADGFTDLWARAHAAFHHTLLAGCGNRHILAAALSLRDAAELYWRWSAPRYDRERDIAQEHRDIADAALARDATRASELLTTHICRTTNALLVGMLEDIDLTPAL